MSNVIGIRPEFLAEYQRLHEDVWPDVLAGLSASNIRNYSIYLFESQGLLFSYWEYHGTDFAADVERMLTYPGMEDWWNLCAPMQVPLATRGPDEWWARLEEIFHME